MRNIFLSIFLGLLAFTSVTAKPIDQSALKTCIITLNNMPETERFNDLRNAILRTENVKFCKMMDQSKIILITEPGFSSEPVKEFINQVGSTVVSVDIQEFNAVEFYKVFTNQVSESFVKSIKPVKQESIAADVNDFGYRLATEIWQDLNRKTEYDE